MDVSRWVQTISELEFLILSLQRVKILFNKRDTALIQMAKPQYAMLAIKNLDKCKLWGKVT